MKQVLQHIKRRTFHSLKLYPIYKVIEQVNARLPLKNCSALEAFAYTGALQTPAFKSYAAYLEAWEINPECETQLKKNLPRAAIKITNSFEEIMRCTTRFDFINVDTHQGLFGDYCENFEFFPLLFRVAKNECLVNLNVIPSASGYWRKKYSDLFTPEHLQRRAAFYKTSNPEQVSLQQMLTAYGAIAAEHGYEIVWHYFQQRTLTYYLVLHLKKKAGSLE